MNSKKPSSLIVELIKYIVIIVLAVLITRYFTPPRIVNTESIVYQEAKTYEDINNKIHSVIDQKEIVEQSEKRLIDSMATVIDVKSKEIQSLTVAVSKLDTVFKDRPVFVNENGDTSYLLSKMDNWVSIIARFHKDSGYIKFSLTDTLSIAQVRKKNLFSTTEYIDINHANPYLRTEKGYSLVIKQKTPKVIIGPYIGYGFDLNNNRFSPSIGISATVPLIKIK